MQKDVYDFKDYKRYVLHFLDSQPQRGYGIRSKMADTLGCKPAFLSQVLNGYANFSLEQAEALNSFFQHSDEQSEYFLLLVEYGRAGTKLLQARFDKQIERRRQQRLILKNRADIKEELSKEDQTIYYSSWIYAAIHILVTIKECQTRDAIVTQLQIPVEKATEVLDFLLSIGLVNYTSGRYTPGVARISVGKDSKMILQHHTNWRNKCIDVLNKELQSNLHLSTVVSIAAKDILPIQEKLAKSIDEVRALIRESAPEEKLYCFNLDFFKLSK